MEVSRDPSLEESQVIDGMPIQVTTPFKYLGSVVTSDGRITEELNCRLGAANRCLRSLDDIMRKKRVSKTTKMRIYKTVIRPILTYGCETWPMTADTERNFRTFENRILRRITGPVFDEGLQKWRIKYNQELYDELQHTAITNWIKSRQVLWAGHVARMGDDRLPKKICQGEVPGRRPRGRPRKSWEKSLKETIRPHIDRNAGDCLRIAFANYLNKFVKPYDQYTPNQIFIVPGVTAGQDLLFHAIADPGDYFLTVAPMYSRIFRNMNMRAAVEQWVIHRQRVKNESHSNKIELVLTMEMITSAYQEANLKKKKIRGIILLNPDNPTGTVLTKDFLQDLLKFAKQEKLHVIMDELFAMSPVTDETKFRSVFSMSNIPDPERTHVLYGISKDFSLAGFRLAAVITRSKAVAQCLKNNSAFTVSPTIAQVIVEKLLSDLDWLENTYFPFYHKILKEHYNMVTEKITSLGLEFVPVKYGLAMWVNYEKVLYPLTEEKDEHFRQKVFEHKLYILYGRHNFEKEIGWLRLNIGVGKSSLIEGFNRIEKVLKEMDL
ncbi:putative inactive 1-aminocyclopropane-1-carboxylate synthase-like protein 2 [Nymphon striatum]|nr:putative inactive 1-aminocyclopropane-1-carboxylate synthase-like protein 2 [Nymphon striatum]